ncbi:hypothetical protein PY365_09025 [Roseiarcaceae bacterium H3SJ34-1]|uniref:hypothetical protein n=1 Tax=Terripilifer ovatus TaxID=3032367 RepID=UPI003AB98952|nr:hypothetical protein [Roseiarcaceae bacterium H3SJ34-1]
MDNAERKTEAEAGCDGGKQLWVTPKIKIVPVRASEGDPTISDDGLGDGLFS